MDLSIIIVNYNSTDFLKRCFDSILENTRELEYEIIVIDNNSPNREIEKFPERYSNLKFEFRNVNDGFGAGCNYGAQKASGKYLAFVNPDIIISGNIFYELFKYMELNTETGFTCGAFTDMEGNLTYSYSKFPGYKSEFMQAMGLESYLNRKTVKQSILFSEMKKPVFADWIYGACMFIRTDIFNRIQGFDEMFFLYYEDVDLQLRLSNVGYRIVCLPYLRIKHFVNSSVRDTEGKNFSNFYFHRSKIIYMYKYFGVFKRNIIRGIHITGLLLRFINLSFNLKLKDHKPQRLLQNKSALKLYLLNKKKLINTEYYI